MSQNLIIRRYAEAFVAYAKENSGLDKAVEDARLFRSVLSRSPELRVMLLNPEITLKEKGLFIDEVLKDYFCEDLLLFLKLIIDKRRVALMDGMLEYLRKYYSHGQSAEVLLKSAYPLDLDVVKKIKAKLEARLGKKVRFYFELDAGILGGVQAYMGNTLLDGSLRGRLEDLKMQVYAARIG